MKTPSSTKSKIRTPKTSLPFEPATPLDSSLVCFNPSNDEVSLRAYLNYENHGALDGCDVQDWLRAEAELKAEHDAQ